MNVKLLIDGIVRQTTVLIAQLSTAAGIRAPLAHVADEVFVSLAREIEAQGVGRKVVADMFGLALRTYQNEDPAARGKHDGARTDALGGGAGLRRDAECGTTERCGCHECVETECWSDADCGGGTCRLSRQCALSGQTGYFCSTPMDECASDGDCTETPCTYETDRWVCSDCVVD